MDATNILYPVEKIVDKRIRKGKTEYRVRWKNYSPETDSWEPAKSLKDTCHPLIKIFNENLKLTSNQNSSSNNSINALDLSKKRSDNIKFDNIDNVFSSEKDSSKLQNVKIRKSHISSTKSFNKNNNIKKSVICDDDLAKTCDSKLVRVNSDITNKNKTAVSKKIILYLEDNEIEEPPFQKSKALNVKSISSDEFSPNSIGTFSSDINTKIPTPRTTFNSMLTEKTINRIDSNPKYNELKRKISVNQNDSVKKLKIFNKDTKSLLENQSNNSMNGLMETLSKIDCNAEIGTENKTSVHSNGFKVNELKLYKSLKRLPYQRHKDSENVESVDGVIRRKSARQMGGSHRFREIIVRKDTLAGFTEISINNKCKFLPNCFTVKILNELSAALKQATNDSSRILLLTSVGKVFSSGLDLGSIVNQMSNSFNHCKNSKLSTEQLTDPVSPNQHLQDLVDSLKRFLLQLLYFPKPIVVGVNGPAIGIGCAILPLCDLIYATESSSFYLPYASLSQFPEGGTSVTLSMLIGMPAANQLLLGGRRWSAKEALNRGLISEVIFSEKFKAELFCRCKKLATVPSMSMETMKCMLRFQFKEKIELSINLECKKLLDIWKTNEFQISAQHFIDKELPDLLSL